MTILSHATLICLFMGLAVHARIPETRPLIIAHRGASGRYPEMTPISFQVAVDEGSDMMECDVSLTRDFRLVCAHEAWMEDYSNVADVFPESRRNTYFVEDDGRFITDYFTVDFTSDELQQQVRKRQRYSFRDPNYDDLYPMASFEEFIEIAQNSSRPVSLLVEIKDPVFFNSLEFMQTAGQTVEDLIIQSLDSYGISGPDGPAVLQSFDLDYVKSLRAKTDLPLTFIVNSASDVTDENLAEFALYGSGIAATKSLLVQTNSDNQITGRTDLVERAHAAGLAIYVWTFRNENSYLAWDYGQDPWNEYRDLLELEMDGYITDFPETASHFLDSVYNCTAPAR